MNECREGGATSIRVVGSGLIPVFIEQYKIAGDLLSGGKVGIRTIVCIGIFFVGSAVDTLTRW